MTFKEGQPIYVQIAERLCDEVLSPEFMERKCREAAEVDVARGYARVVEKYRRRRFVRRLRRWSAVAAGILLPVAVVLLWPEGRERETARETPVATVIKPGGVKAELVLADGSVRRLRKEDRDSLLAVEEGSIRLREESVSYEGRQAPAEARHNTLRVPRGGEYAVTLSDGTEVRLNSESELRYPVAFGDGGNDISMLRHAGTGVAMGNASDAVKQSADYVTDDIDNDGIAKALKHLGLL